MAQLQGFGERIWLCDGPRTKMMTIPFSTRMTIIEFEPRKLWVHSPVVPTPELYKAVESLGTVRHLVAPNKIHSEGIAPWKTRYPSAEVWVSPGFPERHPNIAADHVIGQRTPDAWGADIESLTFHGSSFLDEIVCYHRPSQTLILTDLIQRHDPAGESWFWRAVKKAVGVLGTSGGTARDLRMTFRDRDAARLSAKALLRWDFKRVVIAHGMCITSDAHRLVAARLDWALG